MSSTRKYNFGVVIGRFQPFHEGHKTLLNAAFEAADNVIILVGSANRPRTPKDPFNVDERKRMIDLAMPEYQGRYVVEGLSDYDYSDQKWLQECQRVIDSYVFNGFNTNPTVTLMGHKKDDSSYYLDMFPAYDYTEVIQQGPLDATDVRDMFFGDNKKAYERATKNVLTEPVKKFLETFRNTDKYDYVREYAQFVEEFQDSWRFSPYTPKFITTDAVLIESGHVALIKRGQHPGKGQWALPGGFLDDDDRTLQDCMIRELFEEIGVDCPKKVIRGNIKKEEVFSKKDRDPRGRFVTHAFLINLPPCPDPKHKLTPICAADDAEKGSATWIPLSQLDELQKDMFLDHFDIIKKMTGGM
jgi:bifunctional NMN adenylyltransferase/nudix hydrolase